MPETPNQEELVFDAFNPFHIWTNTRLFAKIKLGAPLHWGIWHGQELEGWSEGIRLLEDWGWLDEPEPRLSFIRWLRALPIVGRIDAHLPLPAWKGSRVRRLSVYRQRGRRHVGDY